MSLHKYAFRKALEQSKKVENDIPSSTLKCPARVPTNWIKWTNCSGIALIEPTNEMALIERDSIITLFMLDHFDTKKVAIIIIIIIITIITNWTNLAPCDTTRHRSSFVDSLF